MKILRWVLLVLVFGCLFEDGCSSIENLHQAFPIVEPDPGHTKLRLSKEGLEIIERIKNPIAAVAVIGPYRSGKSFLLNQLLSLSCEEGFGVGHMRDTKTKGVWAWGTPLEVDIDGVKTSVIYLDTEGFESVGKSNVYDDSILELYKLDQKKKRKLVLCGHSLGGAVAVLATLAILRVMAASSSSMAALGNDNVLVKCITFSQPPVGNAALRDLG